MFDQKLGLCRSHIDREDVNEIMLLLTQCAQRCIGVGKSQVEEILPVVDVTVLQPHSPVVTGLVVFCSHAPMMPFGSHCAHPTV